jgi:hypothetical protein
VRQHDYRRQLEADRDRAQHDLHQEQAEGNRRWNQDVTTLAPAEPGERGCEHDQSAGE